MKFLSCLLIIVPCYLIRACCHVYLWTLIGVCAHAKVKIWENTFFRGEAKRKYFADSQNKLFLTLIKIILNLLNIKNTFEIKNSLWIKKWYFWLDCNMKINNTIPISGCPRGGMVDTRDLKSLGLIGRASSSLAVGTRYFYNFPLKYGFSFLFL